MADRRHGTGLVNRTHDDAAVHVAVVVGIHHAHDAREGDLGLLGGHGLAREVGGSGIHGHVSRAGGNGP